MKQVDFALVDKETLKIRIGPNPLSTFPTIIETIVLLEYTISNRHEVV